MRRMEWTWVLGLVLSLGTLGGVRGDNSPSFPSTDEQLLRRAKVATDTESLLAYLKALSGKEGTEWAVRDLIRQLGDEDFGRRERAGQRLVNLGRRALPALRASVRNADPEIARRAEAYIREIDRLPWLNLPLLVARVLVQRKVEAAVPVLLSYLGH